MLNFQSLEIRLIKLTRSKIVKQKFKCLPNALFKRNRNNKLKDKGKLGDCNTPVIN